MPELKAAPSHDTNTVLRKLRTIELAELVKLSTLAGWNQTSSDWEMLLALSPDGCFGIESRGRVVATTTLLCFDRAIAWMGMVLTHPSHRGRGFARQLIQHALHRARFLGIPTVKLDATEEGRPVYESLGFRLEQKLERWQRSGRAGELSGTGAKAADHIRVLDGEAYGYDRTQVLRALASRSKVFVEADGYLFLRSGRVASYLGPCVAKNAATAAELLTRAIQNSVDSACYWDIFSENEEAVALAEAQSFVRKRMLTRMTLGHGLPEATECIYGIAGFEIG